MRMDRQRVGTSRRNAMMILGSAALLPAIARAQSASQATARAAQPAAGAAPATAGASPRPPLTLVSRHLQWTSVEEGIEVAKEAGFDGIAWTVRPGAHMVAE